MNAAAAPSPAATSLDDFQPLRRAERLLLRACSRGDLARVSLRRPPLADADLTVRAALLAWLVLGAGSPLRGRRLQLLGAWIEGTLDLGERRVPASLWFYRCVFDSAPLVDGAHIDGELAFGDSVLPGLLADRCRIAQDLALRGCRIAGEIRLRGARIGGDLLAGRAQLRDEHDRSARRPLFADRLRVGGDLHLDEGFIAQGELRLPGARIGGHLIASHAILTGGVDAAGVRGDALLLDRTEIGGDLRLDQGFSAAGRVSLRRLQVGGDLDCSGAAFDRVGDAAWGDAAALHLDRARVHGALRLRGLQGPLLGASFAGTRVGTLVDDGSTWGERLVLDGFVYSRFGDGAPLDAPFRLAWLERQPIAHLDGDFRVHPWRRLIAVLVRMGHADSAGTIALSRERRLRHIGRVGRTLPPALRWLARGAHALHGAVAGHGWRPRRLLAWLLAVWLAAAAGYWAAEQQGAMAPLRTTAAAPFSPLGYSADLLLPLVDLRQDHAWQPAATATTRGDLLDWAACARWLGWAETLVGWAALGLLVASLAGRARRDAGH